MSVQELIQSLSPLGRMSKDLKNASKTLSKKEARFLVDIYYTMQENRVRANNQIKSFKRVKVLVDGEQVEEPHEVLNWFYGQFEVLEGEVEKALDSFSRSKQVGLWARSHWGVGPVIAAGLLANIDLTPWRCSRRVDLDDKNACNENEPHPECGRIIAATAGHIWRFAGLDPTVEWLPEHKRPWNASLKRLCWNLGECFVKVSGKDDSFYGKLYVSRKEQEILKNEKGEFADKARQILLKKDYTKNDTDARAWLSGCYSPAESLTIRSAEPSKRMTLTKQLRGPEGSGTPMLPPAHIHARAKRWAVKIFLSHWHHVAYVEQFGELPPKPFAIAQLGHAHFIDIPFGPKEVK